MFVFMSTILLFVLFVSSVVCLFHFLFSFGLFEYFQQSILIYLLSFDYNHLFSYFSCCSRHNNVHTQLFTFYLNLVFYHFQVEFRNLTTVEISLSSPLYVVIVIYILSTNTENPVTIFVLIHRIYFKEIKRRKLLYSPRPLPHLLLFLHS